LGLSLLEETPFEGTIRDNVTFGDAAILDEEIYQTFKDLDLIDFLKEQPNGLNTIIYPEGKQLSYTLSRKLILARAILKKPRLLILEDPLNQMAQEEAMNIIQLLTNPKNNWGLVVVSRNHDWETYCKECYEMKSGKIIK
ncbi:MAG: ATP-binding cassette domain-containing protein, partial [Flavobacteriaceae bacterium]|nr:ATP-binding cassette domain-containing protein [Flavobacteriaceae bacterium]